MTYPFIPTEHIAAVKELYPDVNPKDRVVFVGYDPREAAAYQVLKHSIQRNAPNVKVFPLYTKDLRLTKLYWREMLVRGSDGQFIDQFDGRPHSVEFSFTRFLVPYISRCLGLETWAIFMDCDMLVLKDLNELFDELEKSPESPIAVVKHDFNTKREIKMDGVSQINYSMKLWSAVMCFNIPYKAYDILNPSLVNHSSGKYLHSFGWLWSGLDVILGLDEKWQFVPGHSDARVAEPGIVHFTECAPWFKGDFKDESEWGERWWEESLLMRADLSFTNKYHHWWE